MNIVEAKNEFLSELRRRGYSRKTVDAYKFELEKLEYFLEEIAKTPPVALDITAVTPETLRGWIDYLLDKGEITARTVARKIATLKSLFKFLIRENKITVNPTENLVIPKYKKSPPEVLSQDEIRQLINAPEKDSANFLRDKAILILLYSTGLRVSEIVGLNLENVNFEQNCIRVFGKGAKERIIPLMGAVRTVLLDYILDIEKKNTAAQDKLSIVDCRLSIEKNSSIVDSLLSTNSQLSTINYRPSAISHQPSAIKKGTEAQRHKGTKEMRNVECEVWNSEIRNPKSALPKIQFGPKSPLFQKSGKRMTVRMIQYMVEQYGKKMGILTHIHPHLLRHSIATHLIEEGCSVETVRQTLGHEDLSTTSIYLKTSTKFMYDEHKKFNPTDKLVK